MSTQDQYDFISEDGELTPSSEDVLMFLGFCFLAYEKTNGEPLAIDNELVKQLIAESVDNQTIPNIVVGMKGEAAILQAKLGSIDGD